MKKSKHLSDTMRNIKCIQAADFRSFLLCFTAILIIILGGVLLFFVKNTNIKLITYTVIYELLPLYLIIPILIGIATNDKSKYDIGVREKLNKKGVLNKIGLRKVNKRDIRNSLILMLFFIPIACLASYMSYFLAGQKVYNSTYEGYSMAALILNVWSVCIIGPILEEILFRGLILKAMSRYENVILSCLFSSLLFAVYHNDISKLLPTFIISLSFAFMDVYFDSIIPSIVCHMAYNLLNLALLYVLGFSSSLDDKSALIGLIFYLILSILSIVIMLRIKKRYLCASGKDSRLNRFILKVTDNNIEFRDFLKSHILTVSVSVYVFISICRI